MIRRSDSTEEATIGWPRTILGTATVLLTAPRGRDAAQDAQDLAISAAPEPESVLVVGYGTETASWLSDWTAVLDYVPTNLHLIVVGDSPEALARPEAASQIVDPDETEKVPGLITDFLRDRKRAGDRPVALVDSLVGFYAATNNAVADDRLHDVVMTCAETDALTFFYLPPDETMLRDRTDGRFDAFADRIADGVGWHVSIPADD